MNDLPSQDRAPSREPLGSLRIVFAVIGVSVMLFSGGCSLIFLWELVDYAGAATWDVFLIVALYGGVPFALGVLVTWLALRPRRRPAP